MTVIELEKDLGILTLHKGTNKPLLLASMSIFPHSDNSLRIRTLAMTFVVINGPHIRIIMPKKTPDVMSLVSASLVASCAEDCLRPEWKTASTSIRYITIGAVKVIIRPSMIQILSSIGLE